MNPDSVYVQGLTYQNDPLEKRLEQVFFVLFPLDNIMLELLKKQFIEARQSLTWEMAEPFLKTDQQEINEEEEENKGEMIDQ